jgi:DNA-directed RNA polymerase sigma subunit (sigma70/sigma32)
MPRTCVLCGSAPVAPPRQRYCSDTCARSVRSPARLAALRRPTAPRAVSARERAIVRARDRGRTLDEIARELGLSHERVRQLEAQARWKLSAGETAG